MFRNSREGYVAGAVKAGDEGAVEGRDWILEGLRTKWGIWVLF